MTVHLTVFIHGLGMEFNMTEELAALMSVKGTTTDADLHEGVRKVLQSVVVRIQKLAGW
jgi:hypothetical protein